MKILVACEESQAVTIEFRALGHVEMLALKSFIGGRGEKR